MNLYKVIFNNTTDEFKVIQVKRNFANPKGKLKCNEDEYWCYTLANRKSDAVKVFPNKFEDYIDELCSRKRYENEREGLLATLEIAKKRMEEYIVAMKDYEDKFEARRKQKELEEENKI